MAARCESKPDGSVGLPVLGEASRPGKIRPSRIGPWRAGALILLHVIMAAHIIQWLVMGSTISPIEPSESMQTLENGLINAGAIFFAVAILATLIFGRYVCGWACHVVALQDFCHWLMVKAGIRPRPFRSRLLILVPLILGSYMFIWPSFKRLVLQPGLEWIGLEWPWWLRRAAPMYGLESQIVVEDFWATFPEWYIAVPFLLICGFATVYFLGAKGFCTYACPYGGLFALADPVSPTRVRVDHDKCHQCGHCTAACTSNVRVHEEIRDYGMVVDPGCMKTMDCISVCPNDALSIGVGRPAFGAKVRPGQEEQAAKAAERRRSRYDMSWPGEIAAAVVFFILFIATRGMLDRVPMLMAGGLAAVGTGLTVLLWKLFLGPHVRIHGLKLKFKGRLMPAGVGFIVLMAIGWVLALWGGTGNFTRWRATTLHAGVGVPVDAIMRPEFHPSEENAERARAGLAWFDRADAFDEGGLGWPLSPDDQVRVAYLHAVNAEYADAVDALREVVRRGNPTDALVFQLLSLHARANQDAESARAVNDEQVEIMRDALERHPELHGVRLRLAQMLSRRGRPADEVWSVDDPEVTADPQFFLNKGQYLAQKGDRAGMGEVLDRVLEMELKDAGTLFSAAQLANSIGRTGDARDLHAMGVDRSRRAPDLLHAARIAGGAGRLDEAETLAREAEQAPGAGRPGVRFEIGKLLLALGDEERGRELMLAAAGDLEHDPWQELGVASALVQAGLESRNPELRDRGMAMLERLVETHPDEPVFRHDYSGWLYSTDRPDQAIEQIVRAAELAEGNPLLARRAAQLLDAGGRADEAARWREEATRREPQS